MKTVQTDRLILRPWTLDDAADVFEYASSDKVGPMAGWKPHENVEETRQILDMFISAGDTWAVELKENRKVIGSVGLHKRTREGIEFDLELGYVLSEPYWGKGIIPEAVSAAIRYAFEDLNIQTLLVSHFPFNDQSKRVIQKSGFRYLTHIDQSWPRFDGVQLDEEAYIMTKADYVRLYEMPAWIENFTGKMKELFGERLVFIGLQGSHARGEADKNSDIDIVVLLNKMDLEDLQAYKQAVAQMPHAEKACGFLSDRETLMKWDRADAFSLCYDTKPYFGDLKELRAVISKEDVRRAVHAGACNIRHLCCHNYLYGESCGALAGLYKSAVFVLRAEYFYLSGEYAGPKSELKQKLDEKGAEIIRISDVLRCQSDLSVDALDAYSQLLIEWSGQIILKYGS